MGKAWSGLGGSLRWWSADSTSEAASAVTVGSEESSGKPRKISAGERESCKLTDQRSFPARCVFIVDAIPHAAACTTYERLIVLTPESEAGIMSQKQRRMHLAGFLIAGPVAHSHALWRHSAHAVPFLSVQYYVEIARQLERGRFDLLFFADRLALADRYDRDKTVGLRYSDQDATRLDPMPILG